MAVKIAPSIPPLPAASVDLDALQKALREGKSGEEAVALATAIAPADVPDLSSEPTE